MNGFTFLNSKNLEIKEKCTPSSDFLQSIAKMAVSQVMSAETFTEPLVFNKFADMQRYCPSIDVVKLANSDPLLSVLACIDIKSEYTIEKNFVAFNESLSSISHNNTLFFKEDKIVSFTFPEVGGDKLPVRVVNNLNTLTEMGVVGDASNQHVLLGAKSVVPGADAMLFFFATFDEEYQVFWDDVSIVVEKRKFSTPMWMRKNGIALYNYSDPVAIDEIFGMKIVNCNFEYISNSHNDIGMDLLLDIDGINYYVPIDKKIFLNKRNGLFYDSTKLLVEGVTSQMNTEDGLYQIVIRKDCMYEGERMVHGRASNANQVQFILVNQVTVSDLFDQLIIPTRTIKDVEPFTCQITLSHSKVRTMNSGISKVVYGNNVQPRTVKSSLYRALIGKEKYNFEKKFGEKFVYYGVPYEAYVQDAPIITLRCLSYSKNWFPDAVSYKTGIEGPYGTIYIKPADGFDIYKVRFKNRPDFNNLQVDDLFILIIRDDFVIVIAKIKCLEKLLVYGEKYGFIVVDVI